MNLRTTVNARSRRRPPKGTRRSALFLGVAAVGALMVNVLSGGGEPAAQVEAQTESMSVAQQLGISSEQVSALDADAVAPLQQLVASRSARDADQTAAELTQLAAEQGEHDRRAAEEAARLAAEEAARVEAVRVEAARVEAVRAEAVRAEAARVEAARAEAVRAEAARVEAARAPSPRSTAPAAQAPRPAQAAPGPVAPSGSYQSYARQKLGGDGGQFSCLEKLWGKESGWNPNAQNRSSTAYGIPQFLDSTWAGTGIAKTSDGFRQIDAGLIYIQKRFGSACGAWSHSQSKGWY